MADAFSVRSSETGVPEKGASTPTGTGRALVPLTLPPVPPATPDRAIRPDARFVAQLIATASHAPQTRALRRASTEDATVTYATARRHLPVAANGAALSLVA
jgi:hypothetical protein